MMKCKEIAKEWGVSERTVANLCLQGRIKGAVKNGKSWQIPENAKRPEDHRMKMTAIKKTDMKKPLPIGISDYIRAQSDYYYVDKTMFIKDFLDRQPLVSLFARPRRFGKTLNMDMLRVFFEISEEDTSRYFRNKKIWNAGRKYTEHQGKYPVIFLTFKDVKYNSWDSTISKIKSLLQNEFARHRELLSSDKVEEYEREYFKTILSGNADEVALASSLENLSRMLAKHYEKAPVIIIDEYDAPIQEGYSKNFYEEIVNFMRNFFSGAFKDNQNLSYGFLTGILKIAQESLFSGLNNLSVNTIMDNEYDQFFGFTENEVADMMVYYGVSEKQNELKDWYDGYLFGRTEIYNPWSVINYISGGCIPQAYWVNTGKNEILEDILNNTTGDISEKLFQLLLGTSVTARINQNVVYKSLSENPAYIYSLLLVAGYLKPLRKELQPDGTFMCEVTVPNKEILMVYKSEILSHLMNIGAVNQTTADRIAESLFNNNVEELKSAIEEYMEKVISFYDAGSEAFYHGLMLGLISLTDSQYKITSNREAGNGRYDICLSPRNSQCPGIILELKWERNADDSRLKILAGEALAQIENKHYASEMRNSGIEKILNLGIAFSGKKMTVISNK